MSEATDEGANDRVARLRYGQRFEAEEEHRKRAWFHPLAACVASARTHHAPPISRLVTVVVDGGRLLRGGADR